MVGAMIKFGVRVLELGFELAPWLGLGVELVCGKARARTMV